MRLPLLFCAAALAQSLTAAGVKIDIPYEKFVLSNGLTVIVHEDRKAPIVAVNVWYHVGSKDERPGRTGFAHLFEHLMFNGSEHYNQDYFKVLERLGATDLNGTTNNDRTNYFQNVPTTALDTALWMESDRMGHLLGAIDQAKLDEQRGVVQNEKRQGENQPYGRVWSRILAGTYPAGHPYSWEVIGSMEDLNAASLKDVQEWFKAYYGPSNAVLVVAGDIDAKTAREKVEKYFGAIPPGPPVSRHRAWVARMTGVRRETMEDRVPQARIYKVWNVPQAYTREGDLLHLAASVFGGGKTSRLYKRLVYDEQLATDANAFAFLRELGGQFIVTGSARPGVELAKMESAIDDELGKFLSSGPTPEELRRAQTRYVAGFLRGIERIGGFGGKSDVLATAQVYAGNPGAYQTALTTRQQASPQDVLDVAREWLTGGTYVLEVQPIAKLAAAKQDADRSRPPEPDPAPEPRLPRLQRTTLPNGLKVVLAERRRIPVVDFDLVVDAGSAADQFALPGTASLTAAMLDEGTRTRSSIQIQEELEGLGANLSGSVTADLLVVGLSALKANLDKSLEIYADILLNPAFPEADFRREQKQHLAQIAREQAQPAGLALRIVPGLLFGAGHGYATPATGTGNSVRQITRETLAKFHETWFKPNNATLVVAGDTSLEEIRPRLEQLLGAWRPGSVPKKNVPVVAQQPKPVVYLVDKPGAPQSYIVAAHLAPPKADKDDIAMDTLNVVLGGMFTSRINMNLRENKHWSYGARSTLTARRAQRAFRVAAPVQTDKTREAMIEIGKELRGVLRGNPVKADELLKAQENRTLRLPGSRETNRQVLDSIVDLLQYGLPDDYWEAYPGRVRALSLQDLAAAAQRLLRPDNLIWLVVGDRSRIEAGLRELNLGEIKVLDADGKPASESRCAERGAERR